MCFCGKKAQELSQDVAVITPTDVTVFEINSRLPFQGILTWDILVNIIIKRETNLYLLFF